MTFLDMNWKEAGYRQHPPTLKNGAKFLLQKTVWSEDQEAKLYFINFYYWDLKSDFPDRHLDIPPSISMEVRLNCPQGYVCEYFDIEMNFRDPNTFDLKTIEDWIAKTYIHYGCVLDPHN